MEPKPQPPLPSAEGEARYLALVSGLHVGEEAGSPARLALLIDFLTGMLGSSNEQALAARVGDHC